MSYIHKLLGQVFSGNESDKAFEEFCKIRHNQNGSWQFMDTLKYFCDLANNNRNILLNHCYPEALLELSVFLQAVPGSFQLEPHVNNYLMLLKIAAVNGNSGALVGLFILYETNKEILTIEEYNDLILRAKSNCWVENPNRYQLLLAGILAQRQVIPLEFKDQDHTAYAIRYTARAAELGCAMAMNFLGMFFYPGPKERDLTTIKAQDLTAEGWFEKAANLGNQLANYYLGMMYLGGRAGKGASQEILDEKAFVTLNIAADLGCAKAKCALALMYKNGRVKKISDVTKRCEIAISFYEQAALLGYEENEKIAHADVMFDLAMVHVEAMAMKDAARRFFSVHAFRWLIRSAEFGCLNAKLKLAEMYSDQSIECDLSENVRLERAKACYIDALKAYESANDLSKSQIIHQNIQQINFKLRLLQPISRAAPIIEASQESAYIDFPLDPQLKASPVVTSVDINRPPFATLNAFQSSILPLRKVEVTHVQSLPPPLLSSPASLKGSPLQSAVLQQKRNLSLLAAPIISSRSIQPQQECEAEDSSAVVLESQPEKPVAQTESKLRKIIKQLEQNVAQQAELLKARAETIASQKVTIDAQGETIKSMKQKTPSAASSPFWSKDKSSKANGDVLDVDHAREDETDAEPAAVANEKSAATRASRSNQPSAHRKKPRRR